MSRFASPGAGGLIVVPWGISREEVAAMAASKTTIARDPDERLEELERRLRHLEGDVWLILHAVRSPEDAVKVWPVLQPTDA